MSEPHSIHIAGARQHNLKNISVEIPRNRLTVITGPSGSGKSSLAFDTLFAEGQRRYVQSLSSYARQFLDLMEKPDVDYIDGLSPAIAIEQRTSSSSPRSTIATSTEIYDYLRVLYASCGKRHHPQTGKPLKRFTVQEIVDQTLLQPEGTLLILLAPIAQHVKGDLRDIFERLKKDGYLRVRVDGKIYLLEEPLKFNRTEKHNVDVIVDRLKKTENIHQRLTESLELAFRIGHGVAIILTSPSQEAEWTEWLVSNQDFDPETGYHFPELTARHFSFNSPLGACPTCHGLGTELSFDADLIIPDTSRSLQEGAVQPWARANKRLLGHYQTLLQDLARFANVSLDTPWKDLPSSFHKLLLYGSHETSIPFTTSKSAVERPFEGIIAQLQHLYDTSSSELTRVRLRAFMGRYTCQTCQGARLRPEVLAVTLGNGKNEDWGLPAARLPTEGLSIDVFGRLTIQQTRQFLETISWTDEQKRIAADVIREISQRLLFMDQVGLNYLTLNRETATLSGGEAQRIRLATQLGSALTGVLYVLDEPSIGLHSRDQHRLLQTLLHLRDLGNTIVVVEHDEETIRLADYLIDMGPGAGSRGGYIVAKGTVQEVEKNPQAPTGLYLSGTRKIAVPKTRRPTVNGWLTVKGARENNLKNIDVSIPLSTITCITGVSGSGKSTFVNDILSRALFRYFYHAKDKPGDHDNIEGLDHLDKVIEIDQSPLGRTPRSNALTYTGAFNLIRDLFAKLPASRVRGYTASRFSFNVKGGRCEHCEGDGFKKIEMSFLPDVYVPCSVCKGDRFNRETLEITYKGYNIADILRLTVHDALTLLKNITGISAKLESLVRVGLGYLPLGQPATFLSGGEAQRIKLATELAKKATGHTLYILDEPTTGLHFGDVEQLMAVLMELRDTGNTVVMIEHHLDVIKCADYIIDMGPEGGKDGGRIVATGTPEEIAKESTSYTGQFLKKYTSQTNTP